MKIHQLRLSCVWTLSFLNRLSDCQLGRDDKYVKEFIKALNEETKEKWLTPWKYDGSSWNTSLKNASFWKKYLALADDESKYEKILFGNGKEDNQAWRHFIPLKYGYVLNVKQCDGIQRVKFESFAYSCGIAIVATAFVKIDSNLKGTIEIINKVRENKYQGSWLNNTEFNTLNDWANKLLHRLYETLLPPNPSLGMPKNRKPFITMTIISADDVRNNFPEYLLEGNDICNLKNLVSLQNKLPEFWDNAKVLNIIHCDDLKETSGSGNFEHAILRYKNNRLVWFPDYFDSSSTYRLRLYHRNLTLLSMQTEILLNIISEYNGLTFNKKQEYVARRALKLLNLLKQSKRIFHSRYARVRIEEQENCDSIDSAYKKLS